MNKLWKSIIAGVIGVAIAITVFVVVHSVTENKNETIINEENVVVEETTEMQEEQFAEQSETESVN